jgi:hypothetical protein
MAQTVAAPDALRSRTGIFWQNCSCRVITLQTFTFLNMMHLLSAFFKEESRKIGQIDLMTIILHLLIPVLLTLLKLWIIAAIRAGASQHLAT